MHSQLVNLSGILTNRKCLPWSCVIARVLAQNVNLTSKKRSVLCSNLNKRSTWRLGVGGGDMNSPELASWKFGSWLMYDDLTDVIKPNTIQPNTIQYNLTLPYTIHHNTVGVHEPWPENSKHNLVKMKNWSDWLFGLIVNLASTSDSSLQRQTSVFTSSELYERNSLARGK